MKPSAFYRGELWRAALVAARVLPRPILGCIAIAAADTYRRINQTRREVVVQNLLPAFGSDRALARATCTKLFRQFGLKLADLWRYEAGRGIDTLASADDGWTAFETARARGRGLLLVTPHIGNWEFGAPFLRQKGISLQVITQAEPQDRFTEMRKASRARWGIETLVIGQDPFAFVEVIKRLQDGATVALLIDRPPAPSAVTVKLFGHRFPASIAPAELARATGCVLLPVCIPRTNRGYKVEALPEVAYDRAALGTREARENLTQEIMRQFEPLIRRYLDQWFHFVPIWTKDTTI